MQQRFSTRNISVRDFEEWHDRNELVLAPKFQRREVWSERAKSYLIDTIIKGKPIPKLYMRQNVAPATRRTTREIVDGQQRLKTVLDFIKDGFKISKAHSRDLGGKKFGQLSTTLQGEILQYEFVVDLLQDMPDPEIYDVFARINTYAEKLRAQELRNAKWFGDFKSSVYELARVSVGFFETNEIFTSKKILRMAEAEFISELLLAVEEGIREGKKIVIDNAYKKYDDKFPNRERHEKRFKDVIDLIGRITGNQLPQLNFSATRLFYPLFCALYHLKFGLPRLTVARRPITVADYPKLRTAIDQLDSLIDGIEDGTRQPSEDERRFFDAQDKHTVHERQRVFLTQYLCREFVKALK